MPVSTARGILYELCTLGYNHGMAVPHQNLNLDGCREAVNKQLIKHLPCA